MTSSTFRIVYRTTAGYRDRDVTLPLSDARCVAWQAAAEHGSAQLWVLANTSEWLHLETFSS